MKKTYPYLNNIDFLDQIVKLQNIVYYVKITVLNWVEQPVNNIEGKVTTATININSTSAIRRTANINFVMEQEDQDAAAILALNKKVYLQIGYENYTSEYTDYPIIWFPLGVYVITNISFGHNLNGVSASVELKDKMCLLDGQCGGLLPAATVFDNKQIMNEDGSSSIVYNTIYQIIMQLVNHFGGEQLGNIIISDLDTRIKQAVRWTGTVPLFVLRAPNDGTYYATANQAQANYKISHDNYQQQPNSPYVAGSNVGFILTDFTYPGDLIGAAGDSVVTILDKIKSTLGNFEYFYDLNGCFRFQEIKNYLNNAQSKYILESLNEGKFIPDMEYLTSSGQAYLVKRTNSKAVYSFDQDNELVISYTNAPNLLSIKNDYIIWGMRNTTSGKQYPIRYHLAIDKKPQVGHEYEAVKYVSMYDNYSQKWYIPIQVDRFIDLPIKGTVGLLYYVKNDSSFYTWKQKDNLTQYVKIERKEDEQPLTLKLIRTTDWREQLYFQGLSAENEGEDTGYYYPELLAEWPKIYDIGAVKVEGSDYDYYIGKFKDKVIKDPTSVDYYLDFINPNSEAMQKLCVDNIGRRSVVLNKGNDVNCVFQAYIPDVVIINKDLGNNTDMQKIRDQCNAKGYTQMQVDSSIYDLLTPGVSLNSGYEEIKQTLYQYINFSETVNLQTLPIYFLEPNTCIEIHDKDSFISGEYMISSLSFSLDSSSSLTISASKLLNRL